MRLLFGFLAATLAFAPGCGSKTGLRVPDVVHMVDAALPDASPDAPSDAPPDAPRCRRVLILGTPGLNPSANFEAWLGSRGDIVTRSHTTASASALDDGLLAPFDVVIIDWLQRDYSSDEATVLRDWVIAGGGVIAMSGHDSGRTAHRQVSLLSAIGITYRTSPSYIGIATFTPSPISRLPGSAAPLGPVTFSGGLEVVTTGAFTGVAASVAHFEETGMVVGVTGDYTNDGAFPTRGRVFVFGDEWIEFDSEWRSTPGVPQLWTNAFDWVNPALREGHPACE